MIGQLKRGLSEKFDIKDTLIFAGHLYFLLMLILSVLFYKERLLGMDSAYYSFQVLLNQDFFTGHSRTISHIPQLLPILALKLNCSLKTFLIVYSASFVLFYYLIYITVVYLFRNPQAGLFLVLALGLSLRYKFYGPVGEIILSIGYLALLVGWMTKPLKINEKLPLGLNIIIGCLIASLLVTAHPFISIGVMIFFGFDLLYHKKWKDILFWLVSIYTAAILYYRFVFITRDAYETERIGRMTEALQVLSNYQDYYVYEVITHFFITQYHLPFLAFIGAICFLIFKKKYMVALYTSLSFIAVLAIVFVLHAYLTSDIFIMLDGYLAYLGVVWAIPLAFVFGGKNKIWATLLLVFLMMFSLERIWHSHVFFSERIAYLEELMDDHTNEEHPKAILEMEDFQFDKLWIGWVMSLETLMISSLNDRDQARTIYLSENKGKWDNRLKEGDLFLSIAYGPEFIKHNWLSPRFFNLPQVPYRKINIK